MPTTVRNPSTGGAGSKNLVAAIAAMDRYDFRLAEMHLNLVLQEDPRNQDALFRLGEARRLCGQYQAAVDGYNALLRLNPEHEAGLLHRGIAFTFLGEHEQALSDFDRAAECNSKNATVYLHRGEARAAAGNWAAAVEDFSAAIRLSPELALAHLNHGNALFQLERYDEALADFSRAAVLNPYLSAAYVRRAEAWLRKDQPVQSVADLSEAMRLEPMNARLCVLRGEAYRRLGDLEAALADFDRAVAISPAEPLGWLRRAETHFERGNPSLALPDADKALGLAPASSEALCLRGRIRLETGDVEQAISDFERAVAVSPDARSYRGRGQALLRNGDFVGALRDLDAALRFAPEDTETVLAHAETLNKLHRNRDAVSVTTELLARDPRSIRALELRASARAAAGDCGGAIRDLSTILEIDPGNAQARHHRGKVHHHLKNYPAAVADYTKALAKHAKRNTLDAESAQILADRASVYRAMEKHYESLVDLAILIQYDAAYSSEYLTQRGIMYLIEDKCNRAIADFIVALRIDPSNEIATEWKRKAEAQKARKVETEEAEERRRSEQVLEAFFSGAECFDPFAGPPERAAQPLPLKSPYSATTDSTDFEIDRVANEGVVGHAESSVEGNYESHSEIDLEELAEDNPPPPKVSVGKSQRAAGNAPAAATASRQPAAIPSRAPSDEETDEEELVVDSPVEEEPAAPKFDVAPPTAAAPTAQAITATRPATPVKPPAPKRLTSEELDDLNRAKIKRRKEIAIISIGALIALYWLVGFIRDRIPDNPVREYTTDKFLEQYAKDKAAADAKFTDRIVAVRGKIRLVPNPDKSKRFAPPRVFFESSLANEEMQIEVIMLDSDNQLDLKDGEDYLIGGKVERYKPGRGVVIVEANVMSAPKAAQG